MASGQPFITSDAIIATDQSVDLMPTFRPEYPGYGNPCNGCGECCQDQPCPVAELYGLWRHGACKALMWDGQRYWCRMMTEPHRVTRRVPKKQGQAVQTWVRRQLGADTHCDARKKDATP